MSRILRFFGILSVCFTALFSANAAFGAYYVFVDFLNAEDYDIIQTCTMNRQVIDPTDGVEYEVTRNDRNEQGLYVIPDCVPANPAYEFDHWENDDGEIVEPMTERELSDFVDNYRAYAVFKEVVPLTTSPDSTLTCYNEEYFPEISSDFIFTADNIHNTLRSECASYLPSGEEYTGFEVWGYDSDGNLSDEAIVTCELGADCVIPSNSGYEAFDFYAISAAAQATMNFSCGSGATGSISAKTVNVGSSVSFSGLHNSCTRANYRPTGWSNGSTTIALNGSYTPTSTSSMTWTLQWTSASTVTFNRNGGSWSGPSSGKYATYPTITSNGYPTRSGYVFTGFYTASSGGTQVYNANLNLNSSYSSTVITSNTTLYAQWAQAKCVQSGEHFVGNATPRITNNTVSCDFQCDRYYAPQSKEDNGTVTATCAPERLSTEGEKMLVLDPQGGKTVAWTLTKLYYYPSYGFVCTSSPCTIENVIASADGTINNPIQADLLPSRDGYTFAGFYAGGPHLGDVSDISETPITTTNMFITPERYVNMNFSSINSQATVYAKWVKDCAPTDNCTVNLRESGTNIIIGRSCINSSYEPSANDPSKCVIKTFNITYNIPVSSGYQQNAGAITSYVYNTPTSIGMEAVPVVSENAIYTWTARYKDSGAIYKENQFPLVIDAGTTGDLVLTPQWTVGTAACNISNTSELSATFRDNKVTCSGTCKTGYNMDDSVTFRGLTSSDYATPVTGECIANTFRVGYSCGSAGGSVPEAQRCTYGDSANCKAAQNTCTVPELSTFMGWTYTDASGVTQTISPDADISKITEENGASIILTAKIEKNKLYVCMDTNANGNCDRAEDRYTTCTIGQRLPSYYVGATETDRRKFNSWELLNRYYGTGPNNNISNIECSTTYVSANYSDTIFINAFMCDTYPENDTATGVLDNSVIGKCNYEITCNPGYSQNGGTNTTETFRTDSDFGQTNINYNCLPRTYTITYDAGRVTNTVDVVFGDSYTILEAEVPKDGYTHTGWSDSNVTDATFERGQRITYNFPTNLILSPTYTANTYTVSFDANGGTGAQTSPITVTYDSGLPAIDTVAPTRTGYIFNGWYDMKTGGTMYFNSTGRPQKLWNIASDTTLYAHWTANPYLVTLDCPTNTDCSSKTVYYLDTGNAETTGYYSDLACTQKLDRISIPSRNGKTFVGYFAKKGASDIVNVNSTQTFYNVPYILWDGTYNAAAGNYTSTITENIDLYSIWAENCTSPSNGSCELSFASPGAGRFDITYSTRCNEGYTIENANTYNPTCTANVYNINYHLNDWDNLSADAPRTYVYGVGATINHIPTSTGYVFKGWCTDSALSNCAMTQKISETDIGNKDFYAKWESAVCEIRNGTAIANVEKNAVNCSVTCNPGYSQNGEDDSVTSFIINGTTHVATTQGQCLPRTYTITYNGGRVPHTDNVTYGKAYTILDSEVPQDGYTHTGWSDSKVTGATFKRGQTITYNFATDLTLSPTYTPNIYTVSFDANGGTGGQTSSVRVTYDATLPNISEIPPVRPGYTFVGWFDMSDGGTQYYSSYGTPRVSKWDIASDKTLYAHWTTNTYNITYATNNGTLPSGYAATCTPDTDVVLPTPVRENYTFIGWKTSTGDTITNIVANSGLCTSDLSLSAQWKMDVYTLILDDNNGAGGDEVVYYAPALGKWCSNAECTSYISAATIPTRNNYTFVGYYRPTGTDVDKDFSNADSDISVKFNGEFVEPISENQYAYATWARNCEPMENGTCELIVDENGVRYITTPNEGYDAVNPGEYNTSYAPRTFTITYKGGRVDNVVEVVFGNKITILSDAPKNGYTLVGWENVEVGLHFRPGQMITYEYPNNLELTPVYSANDYTVTFDANGGNVEPTSIVATFDAAVRNAPIPTRPGYTFNGWYDLQNGGQMLFDEKGVWNSSIWDIPSDTIVYAHWTVKTYTITYRAGNVNPTQSVVFGTKFTTYPAYTFADKTQIAWVDETDSTIRLELNTEYEYIWDKNLVLVAVTENDVTCMPGTYLPAGATSCSTCPDGMVCAGGTFGYNESAAQGFASCPANSSVRGVGNATCACDLGYSVGGTALGATQTVTDACSRIYVVLTFNANGGQSALPTQSCEYGVSCEPRPSYTIGTDMTYGGHVFAGWGERPDSTTPIDYSNGFKVDTILYAIWTPCAAGSYKYATSAAAAACNICASGQYSDGAATYCTRCPQNYNNSGDTAAAHAGQKSCKITCDGGTYLPTPRGICVNVGAGYYGVGGSASYGETISREQCESGLTTIGYGAGADESGDCGRKLHVKDKTIYLRSAQKTFPALHVEIDGRTYYGNLSSTINGIMKLSRKENGVDKTYSVVDDSMQ